ncbi:hypothetical protein E1292_31320 [Nonomuraea deserti]|uniref:Uncharacterized protein n=1 Tax=Nonomuraea deserti TaxID=1848322 RepID=A0A4R4V4N9_9ACTN|nr:hypothetical protein [Nonomuraea deserti]TDC99590.1 hypothetical protein E1292_31320 [Nonomuraea deserti]
MTASPLSGPAGRAAAPLQPRRLQSTPARARTNHRGRVSCLTRAAEPGGELVDLPPDLGGIDVGVGLFRAER